jgi:hypothetical protein
MYNILNIYISFLLKIGEKNVPLHIESPYNFGGKKPSADGKWACCVVLKMWKIYKKNFCFQRLYIRNFQNCSKIMVYKILLTRYASAMLKIVVGKTFCVSLSAELQPFQSLQKQYLILLFVNDPGFQKSWQSTRMKKKICDFWVQSPYTAYIRT